MTRSSGNGYGGMIVLGLVMCFYLAAFEIRVLLFILRVFKRYGKQSPGLWVSLFVLIGMGIAAVALMALAALSPDPSAFAPKSEYGVAGLLSIIAPVQFLLVVYRVHKKYRMRVEQGTRVQEVLQGQNCWWRAK